MPYAIFNKYGQIAGFAWRKQTAERKSKQVYKGSYGEIRITSDFRGNINNIGLLEAIVSVISEARTRRLLRRIDLIYSEKDLNLK